MQFVKYSFVAGIGSVVGVKVASDIAEANSRTIVINQIGGSDLKCKFQFIEDKKEHKGYGATAAVYETTRIGEPDQKFLIKVSHVQGMVSDTLKYEKDILSVVPAHQNICHPFGTDDTNSYLVLPKLDTNMFSWLKRNSSSGSFYCTVTLKQVRYIFTELASGVEHLHGNGLAHRDLKPQNIVLNVQRSLNVEEDVTFHHGDVQLIDFDATTNKQSLGDLGVDVTNGTNEYQAPENFQRQGTQLLHPFAKPSAGDIWAMGVILYELSPEAYFSTRAISNPSRVGGSRPQLLPNGKNM